MPDLPGPVAAILAPKTDDYDEHAAARMLATLHACPVGKRLDTLAVVARVFVDEEHAEWWGYPEGVIHR